MKQNDDYPSDEGKLSKRGAQDAQEKNNKYWCSLNDVTCPVPSPNNGCLRLLM